MACFHVIKYIQAPLHLPLLPSADPLLPCCPDQVRAFQSLLFCSCNRMKRSHPPIIFSPVILGATFSMKPSCDTLDGGPECSSIPDTPPSLGFWLCLWPFTCATLAVIPLFYVNAPRQYCDGKYLTTDSLEKKNYAYIYIYIICYITYYHQRYSLHNLKIIWYKTSNTFVNFI